MQLQNPPLRYPYQGNLAVPPLINNNQRYQNFSPQPHQINPILNPNISRQGKGDARIMSPQHKLGSPSYNANNVSRQNNKLDINLNINVNNDGTISPSTFQNNLPNPPQYMNFSPTIQGVQSMKMPFPNSQFVSPVEQMPHAFPRKGFPPSPIFIGNRMNVGPPQPYHPIVPNSSSTNSQPFKFQIQQDKIHCVICQNDYLVTDRDEHIKKHQRRKQNSQNNKIKKLTHQYKDQYQQPKMRPIVEPQEYNIQYNPNSFVLQQETSFSTPTFVRPTYNDFSGGTTDFDNNLKASNRSNLSSNINPTTFNQPQYIRLTAEGQHLSIVDPRAYQAERQIVSQPSARLQPNNVSQPSGRFSRETFISDKQSSFIQPRLNPVRQTIQSQTFNLGMQNNLNTSALSQNNSLISANQKIILSQDHEGQLDNLDASAYQNRATYQRRYEPQNEQQKVSSKTNMIPVSYTNLQNSSPLNQRKPEQSFKLSNHENQPSQLNYSQSQAQLTNSQFQTQQPRASETIRNEPNVFQNQSNYQANLNDGSVYHNSNIFQNQNNYRTQYIQDPNNSSQRLSTINANQNYSQSQKVASYHNQPSYSNQQSANAEQSRSLSQQTMNNQQQQYIGQQQNQRLSAREPSYSFASNPVKQQTHLSQPAQNLIQQRAPSQANSHISQTPNYQSVQQSQNYSNYPANDYSLTQNYQQPQSQSIQPLQILSITGQQLNIKKKKLPRSIGGWD